MKIFNTLTQKKENIDLSKQTLKIYVCGPTVYSELHIGNMRPLILADVLTRYFRHHKIEVKTVVNITDIDDKIILSAKQQNVDEKYISETNIKNYRENQQKLNLLTPTCEPQVTNEIDTILNYIDKLFDLNAAYKSGGNVYFNVKKFSKVYGKLSNQNLEKMNETLDNDKNKKYFADFVLWKNTDGGIKWDSKYGKGRPGWHTQCVAFIEKFLQGFVDIHIGGVDLKFPHHENEIIQKYAYDQKPLANIWMHNGSLNIFGVKMSKSLGNILKIKDFLNNNDPNTLRYIFYKSSYEAPINLNSSLLTEAKTKVAAWDSLFQKVSKNFQIQGIRLQEKNEIDSEIEQAIQDDFNFPNILSEVDKKITEIHTLYKNFEKNVTKLNDCFSKTIYCLKTILGFVFEDVQITTEEKKLYEEWCTKKSEKKYQEADKIRKILIEKSIL